MSKKPVLKFSYKAWTKLQYMRDNSKVEISGFGLTSLDDPLYVEDFLLVEQESTITSTEPTKDGLRKYFDKMIAAGYMPAEFQRVWIHTHPAGCGATPSTTDETTFEELFSMPDHESHWGIMFILGKDDKYSCRLRYNVGVIGEFEIPMKITCEEHKEDWSKELKNNVKEKSFDIVKKSNNSNVLSADKWLAHHYKQNTTRKELTNYDEWCEDMDCEECQFYNYCYGFSDNIEDTDTIDIVFEETYE